MLLEWSKTSASLCATERVGYLSPPRGASSSSPAAVVGVAGHGGRVLGQGRPLGCLSHSVESRLSHRCTLPHTGAPLLLSTLHATPAATVETVHLRGGEEGKGSKPSACQTVTPLCVCVCVCVSLTLMRTSPISTVTRVKRRVEMSITIAEPTLVLKNTTVAIQPLSGWQREWDGVRRLMKHTHTHCTGSLAVAHSFMHYLNFLFRCSIVTPPVPKKRILL